MGTSDRSNNTYISTFSSTEPDDCFTHDTHYPWYWLTR